MAKSDEMYDMIKRLHDWAFTDDNSVNVRLTKLEVFKTAVTWLGTITASGGILWGLSVILKHIFTG